MASPPEPRRTPIGRYLAQEGYRFEVQPFAGGMRCCLRYGTERWEGRGPDPVIAFDRAVDQLAPSKIARVLLREASEAATREASDARRSAARVG